MSQPTREKQKKSYYHPPEITEEIKKESDEVSMHMLRDDAWRSFDAAQKRGEYPMSAVVEGGKFEDRRFQWPPALLLSDLQKLCRLSEPQRASNWIKMSLVASDASLLDFEETYKGYCCCFKLEAPEGRSKRGGQETKKQTGEHAQIRETQGALPAEDSDEKKPSEGQPVKKQPSPTEHLPKAKQRQQCSKDTLPPPITRSEFFRLLCDAIHGIKIYSRKGRVHSWSDKDHNEGLRFLVLGISARLEALTFRSTSRELNLDQLQRYKKDGKLVFPEGDPEKRSTFSKHMADDPLFILPNDVQSPWMKRNLRDKAYFDGKSTEDSAFPAVSLNANHFSKELKAATAGRAKRSAESSQMSAKSGLIQDSEARSDQKQLPPKGKGKQRQGCEEPAIDCQETAASLSDQRSSIPVTTTGLKRKRRYSDLRRATQTTASIQATSKGRDSESQATETDAKGHRKSWCPVHGYKPSRKRDVDPAETEELAQRLDELGIKSNHPHGQLEGDTESDGQKERAYSGNVSEALVLAAQACKFLPTLSEESNTEEQEK